MSEIRKLAALNFYWIFRTRFYRLQLQFILGCCSCCGYQSMFNVAKLAVNCCGGLGKPHNCGSAYSWNKKIMFMNSPGKWESCIIIFQTWYLPHVIYDKLWKVYCDIYCFLGFRTFSVPTTLATNHLDFEGNE